MNEQNRAGVKRRPKKQKKFNPIATFFRIVISIVLVFCVAAGGAAFAYHKITGNPIGKQSDETPQASGKPNLLDVLMQKSIKLNVAVFGVDEDGTRTDVIFVVHFDSKAKKTTLLSVPRDTRVNLTDEIVQKIKDADRYYQSPLKINAVHAYSGKEMGCENLVLQLEDLLGISIDHYVRVDLSAFRKVVDTVGGVEMNVPQDMYHDDPYINLKAGQQMLDGDKAEQLVRFRSYREGDVARVETQQIFLREFAKKVLTTQDIQKRLPDYMSVLYEDITTDISLVDAIKYANYIEFVDMNNLETAVLPGVGQMVGNVSYFLHDQEETRKLVDKLFYGIGEETENAEDSKNKSIVIANGGNIDGLAGKVGTMLTKKGYRISKVYTYDKPQEDTTRIIVGEDGVGKDLTGYFKNAKIFVDASQLPEGTDILVILGRNETTPEES